MKDPKFRVGDMVQSCYRNKYHGVVEKIERFSYRLGGSTHENWLCHIRPVWTAAGRPQKGRVQVLHEDYLIPSSWPRDNVNNVIETTVTVKVVKKDTK